MEILGLLYDGFLIALQPLNITVVIIGVVVGLFIGAMPGLGSVNGVAILLPMTFLVPPTSAIIFLAQQLNWPSSSVYDFPDSEHITWKYD